jgi:hypothetical protein
MKKTILYLPFLLATIALMMLSSCRKDDSGDDSLSAEDNGTVSSAMNSVADDAVNAASATSLSGKTDGAGPWKYLCGVTIDSLAGGAGTVVMHYSGAGCNSAVTRTGTVTVTLLGYANGVRWAQPGATLKIDFTNCTVTKGGNSFTFNGTHYITNTLGGLAWQVLDGSAPGPVTHKHSGDNFTLTFPNGTQRTWSIRRSRTFQHSGSVTTITLTGDTTINGVANADAWGSNRNGNTFTSALVSPIVSNSTCGFYKPVSGEFSHAVNGKSIDVLFGVDAQGTQVSSGCAYGFKLTFTGKRNRTETRVVSYWW